MKPTAANRHAGPQPDVTVSFSEAARTWAKVASLSFGGPAGQIAVMQRILVDEKRWVSQRQFLHALNYCMLLPGPEAMQLAAYIGWLMHRWKGGLLAGVLFVLPGFVSILALSILYAGWGDVPLVEAIFYGIKPAVLAVVVHALVRVAKRALAGPLLVLIAGLACVAIFAFGVPFPAIIGVAALIGWLGGRLGISALRASPVPGADDPPEPEPVPPPPIRRTVATVLLWLTIWWVPVGLLAVALPGSVFVTEAVFFSKTATVTFGGAYAVLVYIAQRAVEDFGWLSAGEMLDGLGMAETTPGPLIQVIQFVGFLGGFRNPGAMNPFIAGVLGSVVTTWVTYAPCFLWILAGAPYIEHLRGRRDLTAALSAVTAAVVGVILNLAVWFSIRTLFGETDRLTKWILELDVPTWRTVDPIAVAIAAGAALALFRFRRGIVETMAAAALLGIAVRLLGFS
ncbi:MAG TPA: chromate efflux transporter [Gemmatimonadota bacterium]|nr:chromate efflux transporter [Gemmatimonadota bacterium]